MEMIVKLDSELKLGQILVWGVCCYLLIYDFVMVEELVLIFGFRVDVMVFGLKGEIWVIECKFGCVDFQFDNKWQGYLEWCDWFFWVVDVDFFIELLFEDIGLIIVDGYGGEILWMGLEIKLVVVWCKVMMQKFVCYVVIR